LEEADDLNTVEDGLNTGFFKKFTKYYGTDIAKKIARDVGQREVVTGDFVTDIALRHLKLDFVLPTTKNRRGDSYGVRERPKMKGTPKSKAQKEVNTKKPTKRPRKSRKHTSVKGSGKRQKQTKLQHTPRLQQINPEVGHGDSEDQLDVESDDDLDDDSDVDEEYKEQLRQRLKESTKSIVKALGF
jgi:hypothetical protein